MNATTAVAMEVPVSEAKPRILELVRRAESGEEVVLTRHGHAVVRLAAITPRPSAAARRALIAEVQASAALRVRAGETATHSQEFLYDDEGLPR